MNPFDPPADITETEMYAQRTSKTYLHAVAIGILLAFVAPLYFAFRLQVFNGLAIGESLPALIREFVPISILGGMFGILISFIAPTRLAARASRYQLALPACVLGTLFSLYFASIGYGYLRLDVILMNFEFELDLLCPALIVGCGTLLHIAVRPPKIS
ncbi:MAG: hypothetical protein AAF664_12480 [Planctomycetota bacterium]